MLRRKRNMMLEIGANLFHTAVLFVIVWGIVRFFGVLGKIAEKQPSRRVTTKNEPIVYTK